jgi:ribonucleotide reductase alpha subunit
MIDSENPIKWSLFCPSRVPLLTETYGDEFQTLYLKYESEKLYKEQIPILQLWNAIVNSQIETGTPYMCYKDHVNKKSNQKNIGLIRSSNLCTEIMEVATSEEYGTCNLASINLKTHVKYKDNNKDGLESDPQFDFDLLEKTAYQVCINLNRIIDINYYPVKESSKSNFAHRPIGIGVQGLAETFILMNLPFVSEGSKKLNKQIFETIYYGSMKASCDLAKTRNSILSTMSKDDFYSLKKLSHRFEYNKKMLKDNNSDSKSDFDYESIQKQKILIDFNETYRSIQNIIEKYDLPSYSEEYKYLSDYDSDFKGAYSTFIGSPLSEGKYQFDLWENTILSDNYRNKFEILKTDILKYGVRNSLLTTIMPTASTSLILNNTECIEPISHCIYVKNTINGSDIIYNSLLLEILSKYNLWNQTMKEKIILNDGSIQNINEIPQNIKDLFKNAFEIQNKPLIEMSRDRAPFIDQSQSLNHYVSDTDKINSIHLYSYKLGLKTGSYYIRTRPKVTAIKFSVPTSTSDSKPMFCTKDNPNCEACSA